MWSTRYMKPAKTIIATPIIHGLPRVLVMKSSNSTPTSAAGTVLTISSHASLASGSARLRLERLRTQAPTSRTISRQKYSTTATNVPRCRATSNVLLSSGFSSRKCQLNSQGTSSRWPELEMGRNSVRPWTMPRMIACRIVMRCSLRVVGLLPQRSLAHGIPVW